MKVYKFGGASIKDAEAVKNIARILEKNSGENTTVVVSAMGKTTNALEKVTNAYYHGEGDPATHLAVVKSFHDAILEQLFPDKNHPVYNEVNNAFVEIEWAIEDVPTGTYDFEYDQIVSIGELLSSKIISAYLNQAGILNQWIDVRDFLKTDNTYREGKVDWPETKKCLDKILLSPASAETPVLYVTQGFIGVTSENYTTTLGREGSDYTAAIIAYCTGAKELTIWKDVPGVLNADPQWYKDAKKLDHISYHEAIELAYYGASVIHPKTIKPLQNKGIHLYVRSFLSPEESGTVINASAESDSLMPSFISKKNQMLISIGARDFSFIVEENLSDIYGRFAKYGVKINLMQNSAISFSVCVDNDKYKIPGLLEDIKKEYKVLYNEGMELMTVRHYDQTTLDQLTRGREVLVDQRSRHTARMVMREI